MPKQKTPHFTYKDEKEFGDKHIIPLLHRQGFRQVLNYHGTHEYGRDLIVSSLNQFGNVLYHGIQLKYIDIGLGEIDSIIQDTKQAFAVPFRHKITGDAAHLSTFTVMNGGNISDQAREVYFQSLRPLYFGNITLFDGREIKNIVVVDVPTLEGLAFEIRDNSKKTERLRTEPPETRMHIRLRDSAISTFLDRPSMQELVPAASQYRNSIEELNGAIPFLNDVVGVQIVFERVIEHGSILLAKVEAMLPHSI